jgi:hypothetical protein
VAQQVGRLGLGVVLGATIRAQMPVLAAAIHKKRAVSASAAQWSALNGRVGRLVFTDVAAAWT